RRARQAHLTPSDTGIPRHRTHATTQACTPTHSAAEPSTNRTDRSNATRRRPGCVALQQKAGNPLRHRTCRILTLVVAFLSISISVGAQETEEKTVYVETELTQTEEKELKKWMDKDQDWKDWCDKWCNKALRHEAITRIRPR